jgi:hypothetical protein
MVKYSDEVELYVMGLIRELGIDCKKAKTNQPIYDIETSKEIKIQIKGTRGHSDDQIWYAGKKSLPYDLIYVFVVKDDENGKIPIVYVVPSQYVKDNVNWNAKRPQFALWNDKIREGFKNNWKPLLDMIEKQK